jgi:hypothetical protein
MILVRNWLRMKDIYIYIKVELEVSKFSYLSGELRYEMSKHFAPLKKKKKCAHRWIHGQASSR